MSKTEFDALEERVDQLEKSDLEQTSGEINFLRGQLDRMDPANRSICFKDFIIIKTNIRSNSIRTFIQDNFPDKQDGMILQHVY